MNTKYVNVTWVLALLQCTDDYIRLVYLNELSLREWITHICDFFSFLLWRTLNVKDCSPEGSIQFVCLFKDSWVFKGTIVREQRINKVMLTHVRFVIWEFARLQKWKSHIVITNWIAVLAIIEKGNTKASLRDVTELMSVNFVLGCIPRSVGMGRSSNCSALNIESGKVRTDIDWEICLRQFLGLMPINMCDEIYPSNIAMEYHSLLNCWQTRVKLIVEFHPYLWFGDFYHIEWNCK